MSKENQWKWIWWIIYDYMENKILECDKNIVRLCCKITETNNESIGFFEKKWFKKVWEETFSIYDKEKNKYYSSILFEKIIKKA